MVLTSIIGLIPYGKFEVKLDERRNLFVVVKGSKPVFRTKSRGKAIRMAIKLDKKLIKTKNWRKR